MYVFLLYSIQLFSTKGAFILNGKDRDADGRSLLSVICIHVIRHSARQRGWWRKLSSTTKNCRGSRESVVQRVWNIKEEDSKQTFKNGGNFEACLWEMMRNYKHLCDVFNKGHCDKISVYQITFSAVAIVSWCRQFALDTDEALHKCPYWCKRHTEV